MDVKRLKSKLKKRSVSSFLCGPEAEIEAAVAVAGRYLQVFFLEGKTVFLMIFHFDDIPQFFRNN